MDVTFTAPIRQIDAGRTPHLVLPNPDILYPNGKNAFGFAAGSVALMFAATFARRYPGHTDLTFVRLGKPEPHV